jgi:hypothetical protein
MYGSPAEVSKAQYPICRWNGGIVNGIFCESTEGTIPECGRDSIYNQMLDGDQRPRWRKSGRRRCVPCSGNSGEIRFGIKRAPMILQGTPGCVGVLKLCKGPLVHNIGISGVDK